ncbi:MAG: glycosyltransferase family 4 protein [Phycisphaerales bacterium]
MAKGVPNSVLFLARRIGLGGMTRQLAEAAIGFGERRIRVCVLAPTGPGLDAFAERFDRAGVRVERAPRLVRASIMPVVNECRPDFVRLVSGTFPPNFALASRLMGEGLPVVETLHAMTMRERLGTVRLFDQSLSPGRRYRAVALSAPMGAECLRRLPGLIPWLRVVPYGMPMPDVEAIAPHAGAAMSDSPEYPADQVARVGMGSRGGAGVFRILTATRLVEDHKDTATLLRAMALLLDRMESEGGREARQSVELRVAGDGRDRGTLEALSRELGVDDRVSFLGWVGDVRSLMRCSDVFVLSTKSESFGRVNVEAASAGTPVVASRVIGCEASVGDGVNGLLVRPGDPRAMCDALDRLRRNEALRSRLGAAGPGFAAQFSMDRHLDEVLEVARELLWKRW